MGDGGAQVEKLADVIDDIERQTRDLERVSVRNVLDAFQGRLFGPLLIIPALVLVTPLGGIPGMPILVSLLLLLIAGQRVAGKRRPWIPDRLGSRNISRDRLEGGLSRARPWAARLDRVIGPRLRVLVDGPMPHVIAVLVVLLAASMPVIGLVPFAVAAPGAAVLLLGLALTAKDGLLALLGYLIAAGSAAGAIWAVV